MRKTNVWNNGFIIVGSNKMVVREFVGNVEQPSVVAYLCYLSKKLPGISQPFAVVSVDYSSRLRSRVALIISLAVRCALTKLLIPKARPMISPTAPPIPIASSPDFHIS